jgi:hypothetical protein
VHPLRQALGAPRRRQAPNLVRSGRYPVVTPARNWMDARALVGKFPRMPTPVKKLNDRFADYDLSIRCRKCGHVRVTEAHVFAKILG